MIDSAITDNLRAYRLHDNEVPLRTQNSIQHTKEVVTADLAYISTDGRSLLLIEETTDLMGKENQIIAYLDIAPESLQTSTKGDANPYCDILFIFPASHHDIALEQYSKISNMDLNIGNKRGITFWEYPPSREYIKCIEGRTSRVFPKNFEKMPSKNYGRFLITKHADPISILQFMILQALQSEYGENTDLISFDKIKLRKWFSKVGIIKEERWKEAIKIGVDVKLLESVSLEQLTGKIKYTRPHPSSISKCNMFISDFFKAIETEEDECQRTLESFSDTEDFYDAS